MLMLYSHLSPGSNTSGMRRAATLPVAVEGMPDAFTYFTMFASHCS
jgi:hypothetical protein